MDFLNDIAVEITDLVRQYGYPALALLALADGIGIPSPAGIVLVLLGALAASGKVAVVLSLLIFIMFNTIGNCLFFVLGNGQRHKLLSWIERRLGGTILQQANRLFSRYRLGAVFLCQIVARTIRIPILMGAIASGIRPLTYITLCTLGTAIWSVSWVFGGKLLYRLKRLIIWADSSTVDDILLLLVVVGVLALAVFFKLSRSCEGGER